MVADFAVTLYDYQRGEADSLDLSNKTGLTIAAVAGNWIPILKLAPYLDYGSKLVFPRIAKRWYAPNDDQTFADPGRAQYFRNLMERRQRSSTEQIAPGDPNDITGPAGYGPQGFVAADSTQLYTIHFENVLTASAPAQVVLVTTTLDSNMDVNTFELGSFGFGSTSVNVPGGVNTYATRVDARSTLGLDVDVSATLNLNTGLVTWRFTSLDPDTELLTGDPLAGFLPPNITRPQGEAFVTYRVRAKKPAASGTVVAAQARVFFDINAPLDTNIYTNTLDAGAPTSSVSPLSVTSSISFTVAWSGADDVGGSGIAYYDVFVSDNGGAFTQWQVGTTATSAQFGGVLGHTYGFYSMATDNVGNRQATPAGAQATTTVMGIKLYLPLIRR